MKESIEAHNQLYGRRFTTGCPFFAGQAEFTAAFDYHAPVSGSAGRGGILLRLEDVRAAYVELRVNGESVGTRYWAPYLFDVGPCLREGRNEIKVTASATLFNLMGPNWIAGVEEDAYTGPGTFTEFSRYTEKYALMPFGLGAASLIAPA